MIDPGRLKTRLVIEAPQEVADDQGGVARSYSAVATIWAALFPMAARRRNEADADGAVVRLRVILRNGFALTLRHRFIDGAKIYRIVALREIDDRRFIEVEAEWRID
jgi:head-tail adaptor